VSGDVEGYGSGSGGEGGGDDAAAPSARSPEEEAEAKAKKEAYAAKHKARLQKVKSTRRRKFEEERKAADEKMRREPYAYLWDLYSKWAGDKLSALESDSDRFTPENVMFLAMPAEPTDKAIAAKMPAGLLIGSIKNMIPGLYLRNTASGKGNDIVPSISVILAASSGLRAASLGRAMYDGKPCGKMFSKHLKKEEQIEWLKKHAAPKAAPTAVATARRVHLLCDEGSMSLASTTVFVIDMNRDDKLQNVLDMTATRDEMLDFIHVHLRPLVKSGQVTVVLHSSQPVGRAGSDESDSD
jgi:hypothetical protein